MTTDLTDDGPRIGFHTSRGQMPGGHTSDRLGESPRHPAPASAADLHAFEAYWKKMRHGAQVPRRSDIDPRGIEPLLANAFIVERIAPGLARIRIAGSHLTDLMGMEVRGMPISAFLDPSSRDALSHHLVRLFDEPATLRLTLASPGRPSAPALVGTLILMPLRSDLGDVSRALGCLVSEGSIGRGPRRFTISSADVKPLGAAPGTAPGPRIVDSEAADLPDANMVDVDTRPEPPALRSGERSYLRLIKG